MAELEKDSPELVELLGGIGQPLDEDEDVFGGLMVEEGPRRPAWERVCGALANNFLSAIFAVS